MENDFVLNIFYKFEIKKIPLLDILLHFKIAGTI